jgi:hypothetical protein
VAEATSVPDPFFATAEGPLSQALSNASVEIPSARVSAVFNPFVFEPAITVFSQTAEVGTKKEQLETIVESKFAKFVAEPHLH